MNLSALLIVTFAAGLLSLGMEHSAPAAVNIPSRPDPEKVMQMIERNDLVPFTLQIGDRLAEFEKVSAKKGTFPADDLLYPNNHKLEVVYKEKNRPLTIKLTCSAPPDYSFVSMILSLTSSGGLTDRIHDIKILDLLIAEKNRADIHCITGSGHPIEWPPLSFKPWSQPVEIDKPILIDSDRGGRSSNQYVPIFLLDGGDHGIWFGPEWSGCWDVNVSRDSRNIKLMVGLPTFDFVMRDGETIELPAAAFGPYSGSIEDGYNHIRKMISRYYLPKVSGRKPEPFVYFQGYFGHPTYQDEKTMYREADMAALAGCEAFVLDGGWNNLPDNTDWWNAVGSWDRPGRFISGVRKFADYVKSKGMRFGIWFEPRAADGSTLYIKYSELCKNNLLDLGSPAGEDLFVDTLDYLIDDLGADFIWIDHNINPRSDVWDNAEQPDRKGLMELGFYQGWYHTVERIFKKHPDVWIESCASGGRIIDLAQLRRSQSIWVNDNPIYANQGIEYDDWYNRNIRTGLNLILPAVYIQNSIFLDGTIWQRPPQLGTRLNGGHRLLTYFSGDLGYGQGLCFWDPEDIREAAKYSSVYKQYRHYLENDYYSLLPMSESLDAWDAWQYHDEKTDSGIVFLFRLSGSKESTKLIPVKAIRIARDYEWTVVAGQADVKPGASGLEVGLDASKAAMLQYRRK